MKHKLIRSVFSVSLVGWLMLGTTMGYEKVLIQQQSTVSGTVTDKQTGAPLAGATVLVKSIGREIVTGEEGLFSALVSERDTLVFSFVSYEKVEVPVMGRQRIDIGLQAVADALDEVVVVGYGSMRRSDLTGAISSVDNETLTQSNVATLEGALQGRVAGVSVSTQSGEPGAANNVRIRGTNSVNAGSSPLYVIDGVLIDVNTEEVATSNTGGSMASSPLATINPSDIESVEVLKDASATAIYGTRGANGVIIVTTKGGKMGDVKTSVNLNAFTGISEITKSIEMIGAQEYINYMNEREPGSEAWGMDTNGDGTIDAPRDVSGLKEHNWQDELFRTGKQNNLNFSAQGGGTNTSWAGSIGYLKQNALIENNDYNSISARLKLDQQLTDKTKIGLNFNWGKTVNSGVASSGGGDDSFTGLVQSIYTYRPVLVYDPDTEDEPVSLADMIHEGYRKTDFNRLIAGVNVNHEFMKNLTLNVFGGGTFTSSKLAEFYGTNTLWGRTSQGRARLRDTKTESFIQTTTLSYTAKPFKRDRATFMIGSELSAYDFETFLARAQRFEDESTGVFDMSKALISEPTQSQVTKVTRLSFFGRLNYSLVGKYLLTATLRADGSSNFGSGNRFAYFPSVALGWNMHEESFLRDVNNLNNLKLRVSYGVTGNDRIPPYRGFGEISATPYFDNGQLVYGVSPHSSANALLRWEATTQYNIGLDIGLFVNRIQFVVDAYHKKTDNMLLNAEVASQTGFINQWQNIGSLANKGIEFTLNTVNIDKNRFGWSSSLNFYLNRNKILSLGDDADIPVIFGSGYLTDVGIVKVGEPLGTPYGFVWDGIYQIDDFTWQNNSNPEIPHGQRNYTLKEGVPTLAGATVLPGLLKYKDLDGDHTVNTNDQVILGNNNPKFSGGFANEFRFDNFYLNMFFQGVYGNQIFNAFPTRVESGNGSISANLSKDYWENRWTPDNPTNRYATIANANSDNKASSYYMEDGSFLRFKTLSFGYNLGQRFLDKIKVSAIKLYVTIDNVYVWSKYSGFDPEVDSMNALLPGYDRLAYPRARTFMFGINISL